MALTICPECGKQVSDKANSCPHCGYRIHQKKIIFNKFHKTICIVISVVIIIIFGGYNIWYHSDAQIVKRLSSYNYYNYIYDDAKNDINVKNKSDLKITDVSVHSNSVSTWCEGTIKNIGDDSFKFVKVKGSFKNRYNEVIEIGDSYAVGSEGLSPGESTSFTIYCERNKNVKSCNVVVYDFD